MIEKQIKAEKKLSKKIKVTQTSSSISCSPNQKKTLTGLGLKKISSTRLLEDTLSIRGMIKKVEHLVSIKAIK